MTAQKLKILTPQLCGVIFLLGVMFACKKPTLEGTGILPDEQLNFSVTDTLTVKTINEKDDSVTTSALSVNQWGAFDDPIFGKSYAGIYTQFSTDRSNIDLGNDLHLNKLVLSLVYSSGDDTYGDVSTVGQNMNIYRVTENMFVDSTYYNTTTFPIESTPLATLSNFTVSDNDSVYFDSIAVARGIQIELDTALGNEFLNQSGGSNFADDGAFKNFFRGLYIAPDTNSPGNGLVYFDLYNTYSKLTLYYNDSSSIDFYINSDAATVNSFQHRFSTTVEQNLDPGNDTLIYVKPMGGSRGTITIPNLDDLGLIAINQAKLTVTILNADTSDYPAPEQMFVVKVNSDGGEELVADQFVSTDFFDGVKTTNTDSLGNVLTQYTFNLPRYYQSIVNGETDYGLHLLTFPTTRISNRVVLGGGDHAAYKATLHLVYTKIEQ